VLGNNRNDLLVDIFREDAQRTLTLEPAFLKQMTTAPLDPPAVFAVLQNATSQNPAQLQAAAKAIEAMHKSADYLQIVQSIALERSVPLNIRKMAILQFKNVAASQWRTKM